MNEKITPGSKSIFFLVNSCFENSRLYGGSQVSQQKK